MELENNNIVRHVVYGGHTH